MQLSVFVQSSRALPPVMVLAAGILRRQVKKKKRERETVSQSVRKMECLLKRKTELYFSLQVKKLQKKQYKQKYFSLYFFS